MIRKLLNQNPLFVFALNVEAADMFDNLNPLFVGVGKVNAAYHLTKQLSIERPSIIVNLGSAGSGVFERGEVVCCTKFVQRDMDATMMGCKPYETPFSNMDPVLEYGFSVTELSKGICGTGDSFEVAHQTPDYSVVEMEAYSLAYIAKAEQIPFLCLKYISDGADHSAAQDWEASIKDAATSLRQVVDKLRV
ncbi:MAG: hypothetical protein RL662_1111 [Bacteroidota bacterium]